MKTLTPNDLRTPDKISLTDEAGGLALKKEDVDFTFDSYSLSTREPDFFSTAMQVYPVAATTAATTTATATTTPGPAGNSSPQPAASSSGAYVWAQGLTIRRNEIISGYYDANKANAYEGGIDCNMCWAASVSNMIAWWQNRYGSNTHVSGSLPVSADGIYDVFKTYWQNVGGWEHYGLGWYLAGEYGLDINASDTYSEFYAGSIQEDYRNQSTGGFYNSLYTGSSVTEFVTSTYISDANKAFYTATQVATTISEAYAQGGIIGITITGQEGRHALTLWGFHRNSSGVIDTVYLSDSNDGDYGGARINTWGVTFDDETGYYKLTEGSYKDWRIDEIVVLKAFDKQNYSCPGSIKVSTKTNYATIRWKNLSKGSNITHEIVYRKSTSKNYSVLKTSGTSLKVKLASDGNYIMKVRTKVGTSFTSDWVWSSFTYKGTPPKVSMYTVKQKKYGKYMTKVGFRWKSNEKAVYALYIDGKKVLRTKSLGKAVSRRYFTVRNGVHKYTLVARDKDGNKSYTRGTLYCGKAAQLKQKKAAQAAKKASATTTSQKTSSAAKATSLASSSAASALSLDKELAVSASGVAQTTTSALAYGDTSSTACSSLTGSTNSLDKQTQGALAAV